MVRPTRELGPRPILSLGLGASYGASNVDVLALMAAVFGYQAHGNLGSSETFDASVALWHSGTLDDDCAFTLTALASGSVTNLFLELLQDGTGGWVIDLPASVVNKTDIEADQITTAGTTALLVLLTRDGGTTWYAGWWGQASGSGVTYGTPAIVLGTAAAAGSIDEAIRRDSTIIAFDATVPVTQAFGDAAATGAAAVSARRDHVHGMPATPTGSNPHAHVVSEAHLSNGSATTYTLDQAFETGSVIAWNTTTLARLGVTEAQPDQATVSAAGSSGDTIMFDYAATVV